MKTFLIALAFGATTLSASFFQTEPSRPCRIDNPFEDCNYEELQDAYLQACRERRLSDLDRIIEVGRENPSDTFFLGQYYARVAGTDSDAATEVRDELLARDPNNADGAHLLVAMVDFQCQIFDPMVEAEAAIAPLTDFLADFADCEHRWIVEMTIAENLMMRGELELAREYAEAALHSAPGECKEHVQGLVQSLS